MMEHASGPDQATRDALVLSKLTDCYRCQKLFRLTQQANDGKFFFQPICYAGTPGVRKSFGDPLLALLSQQFRVRIPSHRVPF